MAFRPYIKGMNRNVLAWVRLALFTGVMVGMVGVGVADATSGEVSTQLANQLFCDTRALLEGNIGILIGLILVFVALWSMINGAKFLAAAPLLVMGALITALPSLIMATLEGLGALLQQSGITQSQFKPPSCPPLTTTQQNIDDAMPNSSGVYYPSRGVYDPSSLNETAPAYCASNPENADCN